MRSSVGPVDGKTPVGAVAVVGCDDGTGGGVADGRGDDDGVTEGVALGLTDWLTGDGAGLFVGCAVSSSPLRCCMKNTPLSVSAVKTTPITKKLTTDPP